MAASQYLTVPHLDRKTIARLFSRIHINPTTGCWEWTGARIVDYGVIWFCGHNEMVHRFVWAWLVGSLPRGLGKGKPILDHIVCDNPPCCNPAHLRLTTCVGNLERTNSVSAVNRKKTHCKNGHPLPDHPNRWNGYGRTCVTCANTRQREAKRKRARPKQQAQTSGQPVAAPNPKATQE